MADPQTVFAMLPEPEIGRAFTSDWWLGLIVLLIATILAGAISTVILSFQNRALRKRDEADKEHTDRLAVLDEKIRLLEIDVLERDKEQQERLYKVQMEMMACKQEVCSQQGRYITREEHHGDILRFERLLKEEGQKTLEAITKIHTRLDQMLLDRTDRGF